MRCVTTKNQDELRKWFAERAKIDCPKETMCIGQEKDGELIAVLAYSGFTENLCQIHVESTDVLWLTRELIFALFDYPFNKVGVKVILAPICKDNIKSLNLCRKLGFEKVAEIPYAHPDGDLVVMSMKRNQCKWLQQGEAHEFCH